MLPTLPSHQGTARAIQPCQAPRPSGRPSLTLQTHRAGVQGESEGSFGSEAIAHELETRPSGQVRRHRMLPMTRLRSPDGALDAPFMPRRTRVDSSLVVAQAVCSPPLHSTMRVPKGTPLSGKPTQDSPSGSCAVTPRRRYTSPSEVVAHGRPMASVERCTATPSQGSG